MKALYTYALIFCATAHFVGAATMGLLARYKVEYLAITWILGIFAVGALGCIHVVHEYSHTEIGMMHPIVVMPLMVTAFLQSVYPLSFTLPGYLQMGRMLKYASPAVAIFLYYFVQGAVDQAVIIDSWSDLWSNLLSLDVLLRFVAVLLSMFYISGIILMPRRLLRRDTTIPGYVKGYCSAMSMLFVLWLVLCLRFNPYLMLSYIYLSTLLNLYLMLRTLETMAHRQLQPVAHVERLLLAEEEMNDAEEGKAEEETGEEPDFNEANAQRFVRTEHYMMHTNDWADSGFGREQLCRETGINRHLMLQALRSQGWNNIHEYLNSYRVARLKRLIETHYDGQMLVCCNAAGFGTLKTARTAFERFYGISLDDFWEEQSRD